MNFYPASAAAPGTIHNLASPVELGFDSIHVPPEDQVCRALFHRGRSEVGGALQRELPLAHGFAIASRADRISSAPVEAGPGGPCLPSYGVFGNRISKRVCRRDGAMATSEVGRLAFSGDLAADFDLSWLRTRVAPAMPVGGEPLRAADLFAGCGAMSLGVREACRALQLPIRFTFAAELDPVKAGVYARNLSPEAVLTGAIEVALDGELGAATTAAERELMTRVGQIDVLLGGPPCQGHSDLNNHTRRNDSRNWLVTRMARFAELFSPQYVVIENVQGVRHDLLQSASRSAHQLIELGYYVEELTVDCAQLGVPQSRRRYMLIAARHRHPLIREGLGATGSTRPRPVSWALSDLMDLDSSDVFDTEAVHSAENERRIRYLFEHDLYDLPDEQRPTCHRTKPHSYRSVYGRMNWDEPAQTITTGFGSTGQGRFVHPLRPRSLTPHEAARLQTIPDFFTFGEPGRTQLQKMIGNSVPPLAMTAVATELFR